MAHRRDVPREALLALALPHRRLPARGRHRVRALDGGRRATARRKARPLGPTLHGLKQKWQSGSTTRLQSSSNWKACPLFSCGR